MFKKKTKKPELRNRPNSLQDRGAKSVFSYYSGTTTKASSADNSPGKPRDRGKKMRRVFVGALALSALALVLYSLLVSSDPKVTFVQDNSSRALLKKPEVYKQAATRLIGDSLLNRNKITFDATGLSEQLESQFTEVASVTVVLPLLGHDPVLYIESFEPKLVLVDGTSAYILDKQGRAQTNSTGVSGLDKFDLPVVKDESDIPVEHGRLALSKEHVSFINEVAYQLKAKNLKIANMVLPPGGSELVVQIEGTPYNVRFNLYSEARGQVGRYLAVRKYFESHPEPAEYVDARVDNHIYYR